MVHRNFNSNFKQEEIDEIWDYVHKDMEFDYIKSLTMLNYSWTLSNPRIFEDKFYEVVNLALDLYNEGIKVHSRDNAKFFSLKRTNILCSRESYSQMKKLRKTFF